VTQSPPGAQDEAPPIADDVVAEVRTAPLPPTSDDASLPEMQAAFVRDVAARFDVPAAEVEAVLARATIRDSIVAAMSRPAERTRAWHAYRPIFLTRERIAAGREFHARHREALEAVAKRTGVPAEIIVAIIGVET